MIDMALSASAKFAVFRNINPKLLLDSKQNQICNCFILVFYCKFCALTNIF